MTAGGALPHQPHPQGPPRRAAVAAGLLLLVLYAATAAPQLVPWDAPEFATAFVTFGIPHPPGTPLVVAWGRSVVALLGPWTGPVLASSMASGIAAAMAGAVLAWTLARRGLPALGAVSIVGIVGASATWWSTATEAEAYAPAIALASGLLAAASEAERAAGRGDESAAWRWRTLAAYLAGLTVAVHQVAWVVAPAALWLAWPARDAWRVRRIGQLVLAAALGGSAVAILVARGRHDPPALMGDARTLAGGWATLTREMYPAPGWWPRQVGLGWQLLMPLEYLLAQYASVTTQATVAWRQGVGVLIAIVAVPLAGLGARWWWRRDRPWAVALLLALVVGSVGAAWHLNLKLDPDLTGPLVAADLPREVRARDTFFIVPLTAWGLLVGTGVLAAARERATTALGALAFWLALAGPGHDRGTAERDVTFGRRAARTVAELPPTAVVLAANDWDAFSLWYAQAAEGRRRDCTVVVLGLVNEPGYRRRLEDAAAGILPPAGTAEAAVIAHIRRWAASRGRPVVPGPWTAPSEVGPPLM